MEREDFGFYVCKAINDAGDVTTRGKLIESSAFMTTEEIEKNKEKMEKRAAKKAKSSRRSSKSEVKSSSSVNVEATVHSKRKVSKSTKVIGESSVDASASFKTKKIVEPPKTERKVEESSELTITKSKDVYIQQTEETYITEVERKTCHTVITINNIHDLESVKNSKEINEIMTKLSSAEFGSESEAVKELVTINYMIQNGLSTAEIQKLFQMKYFPTLLNTSTQSALVQLLEREGHEKFVADILAEKDDKEIDENFLATVGFRAFLKLVESQKASSSDLILSLKPEDFTSANWKNQSSEV